MQPNSDGRYSRRLVDTWSTRRRVRCTADNWTPESTVYTGYVVELVANAGRHVSWMRCCRTSAYGQSDALQHWELRGVAALGRHTHQQGQRYNSLCDWWPQHWPRQLQCQSSMFFWPNIVASDSENSVQWYVWHVMVMSIHSRNTISCNSRTDDQILFQYGKKFSSKIHDYAETTKSAYILPIYDYCILHSL